MDPASIRSGAMSLVFNDWVREEDQRKVCQEYELTMDEDLEEKFQEYKVREEEIARLMKAPKGPMGTVLTEEEIQQINLEEGV
jgi:bifunctional pyridoxal-dependent enzyme with beta-cystathionase and maltose regulon repressor activities